MAPEDTLLTAFQRMRLADISQVPVMDDGRCVGVLDESDLLVAVHDPGRRFPFHRSNRDDQPAGDHRPGEGITRLYDILDRGLVALVLDGERFLGLITRADLLSYLRRQMQ